jgi:hypothetical protein
MAMPQDHEWHPAQSSVSRSIGAALEAAETGDDVRLPVIEAAEMHGWDSVASRLDLAGRALAFDFGAMALDDRGLLLVEAELHAIVTWTTATDVTDAVDHLGRWAREGPFGARSTPAPSAVWPMLVAVDYMRRHLGYPPHVAA